MDVTRHPSPSPSHLTLPCRFLSYRFCGVQPSQSQSQSQYHSTPTPTPHHTTPHHTRTRSHTRPFLFFSRPRLPLSVSAYPHPPIISPQCCPRYPSIAVTASACSLPWCRSLCPAHCTLCAIDESPPSINPSTPQFLNPSIPTEGPVCATPLHPPSARAPPPAHRPALADDPGVCNTARPCSWPCSLPAWLPLTLS
jgi:hypothetical protein